MCELFALSSRWPADVDFSLEAFSRRGSLEGPHKDGWGVCYSVDRDVRLIREPEPFAGSAWVRFLEARAFRSSLVISHIRHATHGEPALRNTQPFARELGGRMHVFAHNGDLGRLREDHALSGAWRPVGETDSEHAFCMLLERLAPLWLEGGLPALERRLDLFAGFAADLRPRGPANILYFDGDALFVHGHRRRQKGGDIRPPGLHLLGRECTEPDPPPLASDGLIVEPGSPAQGAQRVVLVASVPLTAEDEWRPLAAGECLALRGGRIVGGTRP